MTATKEARHTAACRRQCHTAASAAESESADPPDGRGWDQGSLTVRLDLPECDDSAVGKTAHAMRSERPLP